MLMMTIELTMIMTQRMAVVMKRYWKNISADRWIIFEYWAMMIVLTKLQTKVSSMESHLANYFQQPYFNDTRILAVTMM